MDQMPARPEANTVHHLARVLALTFRNCHKSCPSRSATLIEGCSPKARHHFSFPGWFPRWSLGCFWLVSWLVCWLVGLLVSLPLGWLFQKLCAVMDNVGKGKASVLNHEVLMSHNSVSRAGSTPTVARATACI